MRTLLTIVILCVSSSLFAQTSGWKADPERVKQYSESRTEENFDESKVPDYQLPDPLRTASGVPIRSPQEWEPRRKEILETFRREMYGRPPGLPDNLTFEVVEEDKSAMNGNATLRRIAIKSNHQGRSHEFEAILFIPNKARKPAPVFLLMNNRGPENTDPTRQEKSGFWPAEEIIDRGYAIAAIQNNELAPDDDDTYHEGIIRLFEGDAAGGERPPEAYRALTAWGWGASRVVDYFEKDPMVDASKVAVIGHSRGGKASLWAGAEDQRFALVISNDSGAGGAALSKRRFGETIRVVNRFTHWFNDNFDAYNDREVELPFDQHLLISLMAPRAVAVGSADLDLWADPRGEFLSLVHASPVFALWNYKGFRENQMPPLDTPLFSDRYSYHVRSDGHNLTPYDWHVYMDFADKIWK